MGTFNINLKKFGFLAGLMGILLSLNWIFSSQSKNSVIEPQDIGASSELAATRGAAEPQEMMSGSSRSTTDPVEAKMSDLKQRLEKYPIRLALPENANSRKHGDDSHSQLSDSENLDAIRNFSDQLLTLERVSLLSEDKAKRVFEEFLSCANTLKSDENEAQGNPILAMCLTSARNIAQRIPGLHQRFQDIYANISPSTKKMVDPVL